MEKLGIVKKIDSKSNVNITDTISFKQESEYAIIDKEEYDRYVKCIDWSNYLMRYE